MRASVYAAMGAICLCVGFAAAVVANRGQPFTFVHSYIKPETVVPGGSFTAYFVIKDVIKVCDGVVHRTVVDSRGNIWQLPVGPVDYATIDYGPNGGPTRTFAHTFMLDPRAEPGPAVYRARAEFWCNPIQRYVWSIDGGQNDVAFSISTPPRN
jgi:hypothetical protein